jgi:ABC-type transport system involved in multi-copper enzyme maturation permease subunit
MRAVMLLGLNFVRTQWVVLAIITAYLLGMGGVFRGRVHQADVIFFLRWHAGYAVFLAAMAAIPALQMERKTRRVLAVLSKGIHRWQYLGGLLCGCTLMAALFCLLVGCIAAWLCQQGGFADYGLVSVIVALFCCSVAAAATGLFFSTFLHPFLAMAATSTFLFLPIGLETMGRSPVWQAFPVAWIFHYLFKFQLQPAGSEIWEIAAAALFQTVVLWLAAALVFARRDVTISPE